MNMAKLLWPGSSPIYPPVGHSDWRKNRSLQAQATVNSKRTPNCITSHVYFGLLRNPLTVLLAGSKFPEFEILFGSNIVAFVCQLNHSSFPLVTGNESKTEHLRYGEASPPYPSTSN